MGPTVWNLGFTGTLGAAPAERRSEAEGEGERRASQDKMTEQ